MLRLKLTLGLLATLIILLLVGIAFLLFGPSQLPKLIKGMGEAVRETRKAFKEDDVELAAKESLPTLKMTGRPPASTFT